MTKDRNGKEIKLGDKLFIEEDMGAGYGSYNGEVIIEDNELKIKTDRGSILEIGDGESDVYYTIIEK